MQEYHSCYVNKSIDFLKYLAIINTYFLPIIHMSYFRTYLEEKNIDLDTPIEFDIDGTMQFMNVAVVLEFVENLPKGIQNKIKAKIVMIDYLNQDIMPFIVYIAKGMAKVGV
ncbi:MAG: hypothetical protein HC798_01495 [Polaribacter sp.]|nr:hypothetical protein [Polaribacter sp.]